MQRQKGRHASSDILPPTRIFVVNRNPSPATRFRPGRSGCVNGRRGNRLKQPKLPSPDPYEAYIRTRAVWLKAVHLLSSLASAARFADPDGSSTRDRWLNLQVGFDMVKEANRRDAESRAAEESAVLYGSRVQLDLLTPSFLENFAIIADRFLSLAYELAAESRKKYH